MKLMLMRHGRAVSGGSGPDSVRWLTAEGRVQARRAGAWLAERDDLTAGTVWCSPLVRAVQTAELTSADWGVQLPVESRVFLADGDNGAVLEALDAAGDALPVLAVGHEPQIGHLVRILVGDAAVPGPSAGTLFVLDGTPEPGGCRLVHRLNG